MKKKKQISQKKIQNTGTQGRSLRQKMNISNYIFLFIILGGLVGIFFFIFHTSDPKDEGAVPVTLSRIATSTLELGGSEINCPLHRKLDGLCVQLSEQVNSPIVGVMVENALDAQPLSGVGAASIVYEAPAEGNIPRLLTIFPLDAQVEKVGPVRSARPYFLDWTSEYADAMYMHVGGSPEALEKIRDYDLFDMNEMYNGKTFWRAMNRFAPHNTYTSSDLWKTAHEKNIDKFQNDEYVGWKYGQKENCKTNCLQEMQVTFSPVYNITWKYDIETGLFERSLNGRVQKDEDGTAYVANNVIIQEIKIEVIDEVGRKKITTIGEGSAKILSGGRLILGTWKKKSRSAPTQWFDEQGSEVKLQAGKTWVEVVGTGMTSSYN